MPYVLYALVVLEISVSMYKMKHNRSHYSIKTHLNKAQTFKNVQNTYSLPFPAILLTSGITIHNKKLNSAHRYYQ